VVNHKNHTTDFFYALLVTARNPAARDRNRYAIKHFLFRRGDASVMPVVSTGSDFGLKPCLDAEPQEGLANEEAFTF
jgi:hypothetical protein